MGAAVSAQNADRDQVPTIRTTTREVVLDVIVRDNHHHAVADIRPGEIEVFEDGVKQKINAFRNVQGTEQLQLERKLANGIAVENPAEKASSSQPTRAPANTLHELNFVSVVFAQIAPLDLEFAREAVLDFLESNNLPNTYVTIYRLDRGLSVVQPYTADRKLLTQAVDSATKGLSGTGGFGSSAVTASSINTQIQATELTTLAAPTTSSSQAAIAFQKMLNPLPDIAIDPLWARNTASQDASVAINNALETQARLATGIRFAESLSNGMDTMDALRQLVRAQAKLPGRKVVLYLADGLTLPVGRRDVVSSVIGYANQTEVSFYTVDTRGLSTESPLAEPLANQARVGAESSVNKLSPRMGHLEDDDIQLTVSSNKQLAMVELAEATGGFAVTNTNQIALPMQRVMEDIRTHYEVAYTPAATNYDGHFRKIEVRIARPHVTVQTRSGYFAVPELNGEPLQPFEMAALKAMNLHPNPNLFPYDTALLRFRPKPSSADYEMAFDVPVSSLRVVTDAKTGDGHVRFSVVALIHKQNGEVVGKVSRDLVRQISHADLARVESERILYAEPIELPAGHYEIDTAVTDNLAEKTTVKRLAAFVDSGKNLGISSLQLVRGIQSSPGPRDQQDPFETTSGRIVPTLAGSVPSGQPLQVYFLVYPETDSAEAPRITLQLFRNGEEVGTKDLAPPKPAPDGTLHCLLRMNPVPGQYDMLITARQGRLSSEARLAVDVTPSTEIKQ